MRARKPKTKPFLNLDKCARTIHNLSEKKILENVVDFVPQNSTPFVFLVSNVFLSAFGLFTCHQNLNQYFPLDR